jgi:hypothetical protein
MQFQIDSIQMPSKDNSIVFSTEDAKDIIGKPYIFLYAVVTIPSGLQKEELELTWIPYLNENPQS